jgi:hypothetical protein
LEPSGEYAIQEGMHREVDLGVRALLLGIAWLSFGCQRETNPAEQVDATSVVHAAEDATSGPATRETQLRFSGGPALARSWGEIFGPVPIAVGPKTPEVQVQRIDATTLSTAELLEYLSSPEQFMGMDSREGGFESGKWSVFNALAQRQEDFEQILEFWRTCEFPGGKEFLLMTFGKAAREHPELVDYVPPGLGQGSFRWVVSRAREGHAGCLDQLAANFWDYGVPSRDMAELPVFMAEQGRRELIPSFVEWIDAADLSLAGACFEALQAFYPEADAPSESPRVAREFFRKYAASEFPELLAD